MTGLRLVGAMIVDVVAGVSRGPATIEIEGGRVRAIEAGSGPPTFFVSPGLIDAHVHLCLDGSEDPVGTFLEAPHRALPVAEDNATLALRAGITTVRDLGGPADTILDLARRVERGQAQGPSVVAAGAPLTRPGGHCHFFGGEVATPADAGLLVERQARAGAGVVKVIVSGGGLTPGTRPDRVELPADILRAVVDAGHGHGLPVTAHCHARAAMESALDAGVDMIEHASFVEDGGRVAIADDLMARIRDRDVAVGPTVAGALRTAARYRATGRTVDPADRATIERLEARRTIAGAMHAAGVTVVAGSDGGVTDTPVNVLVEELEAYRAVGFSPDAALRTATVEAARVLRLVRTGEVREGWAADLLVLAGDPLLDLGFLRRPLAVVKAGRVVAGRIPAVGDVNRTGSTQAAP